MVYHSSRGKGVVARRIKEAIPNAALTYYRVAETETESRDETTIQHKWTIARLDLTVGEIRIVRDIVLRHWTD